MSHEVTIIDRSVEQTNVWLAEVAEEFESGRGDAYRVVRRGDRRAG